MQNDQKMKELQNTVVQLCNQHLFQSNSDLSQQEKKLLQTIFGESVLLSNQVRNKMLQYKDLIIFLLNEVVLKLFDLSEPKKVANRRENSIGQTPTLSFANQLKKIQEPDLYLDKEMDLMEFSQVSSRMQESQISTSRMRS